MCEVRWTLSWGKKVGQRAVKNPLSNTCEQEGIKYWLEKGTNHDIGHTIYSMTILLDK